MKFKDEYKKELNKISPTEEQCERIRSGVAKKIAERAPVKKKKPLYLRVAAISGASICAAAVLIVVIFGMGGEKRITTGLLANEGNNTNAGNADQNFPPKSEDSIQQFGSASSPTANAQSNSSSAITSLESHTSIGRPSSDISDSGKGTASVPYAPLDPTCEGSDSISGVTSSENPPMGGGGSEPIPGEPATAGGDKDDPYGAGGGEEISYGFVYLAFSEDNSICEVTVNEATRSYRLDKDASAPPLSDDMAFGALTNNGLDVLVQFDEDMMFIYSIDGRIYNIYRFII